MVGFEERKHILACYNCGDFHELWWVLKNDSIFWHVILVVIFMKA